MLEHVERTVRFGDMPGLAPASAPGHDGRFVLGAIPGARLAIQAGRLHVYDGIHSRQAARTVDALASFGVDRVILTNAAGGLVPALEPGTLLAVGTAWLWPYRPWEEQPLHLPTDFRVPGCPASGDYIWMHGPCYETRAEIATLRRMGLAAVGMSTAPEMQRCAELGMPAAVVSCITNNCCRPGKLTHEAVLETATRASANLRRLLTRAIENQAV